MLRRTFLTGLGMLSILCCDNVLTSHPLHAEDSLPKILPMDKPLYDPYTRDEDELNRQCAPLLNLSVEELKALAPPQCGFLFSACPNCKGGSSDDNLVWNTSLGDKVQCQYCKVILPSEQYPENAKAEFARPDGVVQTFRYHQNAEGKKFWFEGRRWYEQKGLLERGAFSLAQLYQVDPVKYREAGQRSAAILERFAEIYPNYIIKSEYPHSDKYFVPAGRSIAEFFGGSSAIGYASRFSSFGFLDISVSLLMAYDQLSGSDFLNGEQRKAIETKLFGAMVDFVASHDGILTGTNMMPSMWRSQAMAANILRRPEIAAGVLPGIRKTLETYFYYDHFCAETTISYHMQVAGGLQNVAEAYYPKLNMRALKEREPGILTDIWRAVRTMDVFRLPNGHYAALNDTWGEEFYGTKFIDRSTPCLMPGMGYGILGGGSGKEQWQAHLKFTGRFGHHHFDSLNLLLFGKGSELVSDVGYIHNKSRPFTASTVGHNTVVVNQKNQVLGDLPRRAMGKVLLFNAKDEDFQAMEAAAPEAYPGVVTDYRRALIAVRGPGGVQYVVDVFNVAGGNLHDWVLHGSVLDDQSLELAGGAGEKIPLVADALLPPGFEFKPPTHEYENIGSPDSGPWEHGHFKDVHSAKSNLAIKATFRLTGEPSKGLQSWIIGAPGSTYYTTRSWAARGVKDQARLDEKLRTSLIVRRKGPANRFTAVHVPFEGGLLVRKVTAVPWPEGGVALRIEHVGGTDYIIYQNDSKPRAGELDGRRVLFDGRVGLIRHGGRKAELKLIGGSRLQFGDQVLASKSPSARLIEVKGNSFVVEGSFKVSPDEVIVLRDASGQTLAFRVARTSAVGGNTRIETREQEVLTTASGKTLKMKSFPFLELPGPHQISTGVLASQK